MREIAYVCNGRAFSFITKTKQTLIYTIFEDTSHCMSPL